MATNQQTSRLDFLFRASHTVFANCPELSRFYMSEFQQTVRQHNVTPAKVIKRSACPSCGQVYAPGLNTSVTVETKRKRNQLVYRCKACTHTLRLKGSYKPTLPKPAAATAKPGIAIPIVAIPTTPTVKKNDVVQDKSKKKKPKKNSLQAMLAKRKEQTNQQNNSLLGFGDPFQSF
ncbi:hypothetical protein DFQ28_002286 [Apophysomyces sp. BC1034]|nr:hypothetical protein DFQ30_003981 [Apophysomyces sp. BC1015]KAG0178680.1 hypothetical protein DFQ29_003124 [Apophysomyces sp. BC1021]KAG0190249.1 hypothetical protein DFQ28_002286 [Apophysomyces sp. BC1034]